jgi:cytochrome o ubiquinol oxidase subunit 2
MPQHRKPNSVGQTLAYLAIGLAGFTALISVLLHGKNVALFNPKGWVAHEQYALFLFIVALLLVVAVPTIVFLYITAWKYRESNQHVTRSGADKGDSKSFVIFIWALPAFFMLILALVMWPVTHRLEPQKTIVNGAHPLTIQVVATRWKWVFIYPEQKIATVNYVQMPIETPVQFDLTADDAPMSSFWIPNLGGQLYAMTGMVNRLNLMAGTIGDYPGRSAEINGAGFAGMQFTARAASATEFNAWVNSVRAKGNTLSSKEYDKLAKPSENVPPTFYGNYENGLYDKVLMKYMAPGDHSMHHGM